MCPFAYWQSIFPGVFRTPALYGKNYVDGKFFEYPLSEETLRQFPPELYDRIMAEMTAKDPVKLSEARNYRDYMNALAGPTLQKIFYEDYPEKLWGIPTSELSANWAPQRIEIRKEKKPFHADQWSAVAQNGCGQIMEILAQKIIEHGGTIDYNVEVQGFDLEGDVIDRIRTEVAAAGGQTLLLDGEPAGELSSVGWSPLASACVALGYVRGAGANTPHAGTPAHIELWGDQVPVRLFDQWPERHP